jgi:glycosyltransferase involved in cell wall biosynthesis
MKYNILHITSFDKGGAGLSVVRINKELIKQGVNSKVLVKRKFSNEKEIYVFKPSIFELFKYYLFKLRKNFFIKKSDEKLDYFSDYRIGLDITKSKEFKEADIIHLHWISEFVDLTKLFKKLGNKKLIWTVRDTNPFTGGCHYFGNCINFKNSCGNCPQLMNNSINDFSRKTWINKNKIYKNISRVVCLSNWEKEYLLKSSLLGNNKVQIISPGMPCELKKVDKNEARDYFNLPKNKFLVLFGSFAETKTKGFIYLKKAAKLINNADIEFVSFGSNLSEDLGIKVNQLGMLNNFDDLSKAYSSVDVVVMPSLQETFGKVFAEGMACGTPTICFNMGGPRDIIEDGENGFLLKIGDYKGITNRINFLMNNPNLKKEMGKKARQNILQKHTIDKEVNHYIKLYNELLSENK